MSMSKISHFTKKAVRFAKNTVGSRDESAAPQGGGEFADYAVLSLHCLRIYLETLLCSTLLILERGSDRMFECLFTRFPEEFAAELKRSEILGEFVF